MKPRILKKFSGARYDSSAIRFVFSILSLQIISRRPYAFNSSNTEMGFVPLLKILYFPLFSLFFFVEPLEEFKNRTFFLFSLSFLLDLIILFCLIRPILSNCVEDNRSIQICLLVFHFEEIGWKEF